MNDDYNTLYPVGKKHFNWTVIGKPRKIEGKLRVLCRCGCGTKRSIFVANIKYNKTKSCCSCAAKLRNKKHGMFNSRTYCSWQTMKDRCKNVKAQSYPRYGGRGITFCKRWEDFNNFYEDMGERPEGKTLDRKNNNKNYCKSNCRWATPKQQSRNTSQNRVLKYKGRSRCMSEWSEITGVSVSSIKNRLNKGWSVSDTLSTPMRRKRKNHE